MAALGHVGSSSWKTFDADVAGQPYIGIDYADITDVAATTTIRRLRAAARLTSAA